MAGAADKKQAVANIKILKEIHILSAVVLAVSTFLVWYVHRPSGKWPSLLLTIPGLVCEYIIEKTGRPKYGVKDGRTVLISAGQDLKQSGLVEYMFDIIYVTLICHILMCVFGANKVWLLYLSIPVYAGFKAWSIGKQFLPGIKAQKGMEVQQEPVKSKRQQKMEKKQGKQQVRYR